MTDVVAVEDRERLLLPRVKDVLVGTKPLIRRGDETATTVATAPDENLIVKN